jgi:hypothetical protein
MQLALERSREEYYTTVYAAVLGRRRIAEKSGVYNIFSRGTKKKITVVDTNIWSNC